MKVSLFTSWNIKCGIADYSRRYCSALEAAGASVEVVSRNNASNSADFARLGEMMNSGDIAHIQHEYGFFGSGFLSWIRNYYRFTRHIRIPSVITLHEIMQPTAGGALFLLKNHLIAIVHRTLLSTASLVLVHTREHRRILISMGISPDKIAIFPHPVPMVSLPDKESEYYKRSLGIDIHRKVVTIFGFIFERKGYETALNALLEMDNCTLLIAGGEHPQDRSGYYQKLLSIIDVMGLKDRVHITGYISENEYETVMGATDLVLAPFLAAAGSGSLSLAIAYHKPILSSDIDPLLELRENGLEMQTFKRGNSSELCEKAIEILADGDLSRRLAESSRKYAQRYSYNSCAGTAMKYYAGILGHE